MDIQPSRGEVSSNAHTPQKVKSTAISIIRRLSVERREGMSNFIRKPNAHPSKSTNRFASSGFVTLQTSSPPVPRDMETDIAILNAISPTASSIATTCKSVLTKLPEAPVCLIVTTVEAGAVAAASAASTAENPAPSPSRKYAATKTKSDAMSDSRTVITATRTPFRRSSSNRKNSPALKAIKASAISAIKSMPCAISCGTSDKPYCPSRIPATI